MIGTFNSGKNSFILNLDGTNNIYSTNLTGLIGEVVGLTSDGKKIFGDYYPSNQNGEARNFIANIDGTNFTNLSIPNQQGIWRITWMRIMGLTPDQSKAFGNFTDLNFKNNAYSINADGSGFKNLTPPNAISSTISGISPDGLYVWGYYQDKSGNSHAFTSNLEGTSYAVINPNNSLYNTPSIIGVTNNNKIYGNYYDNNFKFHFFVCNTDGSNLHELPALYDNNPVITGSSDDGTKIYGQIGTQPLLRAFIMNTDGTDFITFVPPKFATYVSIVKLTSDGNNAIGTYKTFDGNSHLFISKIDGSNFIDLTPSDAINSKLITIDKNNCLLCGFQTPDKIMHGFTYQI